jgi:lipid II isoglutaminyl synthase (glutamine-hydrolysing)
MADGANGPDTTKDGPAIRLGHLYPDQLNMYGDRGNIITLRRRCEWRGIALHVTPLDCGEPLDPAAFDLLFIGGGQDKEQSEVARDLRKVKGAALHSAVADGMPLLAVCGGYQLLAHGYRPAEGPELPGAGIFDAMTIHFGKRVARCIGNIALDIASPVVGASSGRSAAGESSASSAGEHLDLGVRTLVGFENHGGRTYLGPDVRPLGRVLAGHGNNSEDGFEGAVYRHAFGTYLHGSLLPKNPHFADHLLRLALERRYGTEEAARLVTLLDDTEEWRAHNAMLARLGVLSASSTARQPAVRS